MRKFLLIGRTGVGKSSFVNATFGTQLAKSDAYQACTSVVQYFAHTTSHGDVCVIDTPGLADADDQAADEKYLRMIASEVDLLTLHATLYLTRLDDTRLRAEDRQMLKCISMLLGSKVWLRAWIVFTFAGRVSFESLYQVASIRQNQVEACIAQTLGLELFRFKKCILIDNVTPDWYSGAPPVSSILSSD